jgi:ubiquinone/menaquinone biosynthesis C-methylase UbiE
MGLRSQLAGVPSAPFDRGTFVPFSGQIGRWQPDFRTGHGAPEIVPESRFGRWFLGTRFWTDHVLKVAVRDLRRLMEGPNSRYGTVVDVGCGHGQSFRLLRRAFRPARLIGIDIDRQVLTKARVRASGSAARATLVQADCTNLPLGPATVDLIFCHQTFHHLTDQSRALDEFRRVLKPGGLLLFAESTRAYIQSWIIRLLFRHPMEVQRSAAEYVSMLRAHGFSVPSNAVSYPYLWWSRSDLGLAEQIFGVAPQPPGQREETLIDLVATKHP